MSPNHNAPPEVPDWCLIAERAAQESDPKKLIQLVRALCDRLQEAELKKKKRQPHLETLPEPDLSLAKTRGIESATGS